MSMSSSSSEYGDDDALLQSTGEEIDFYAILNVPKDAAVDEINRAYRQRCKIFHPDRHFESENKRAAEMVFVKLRRAYETLMDPKLRAIYDAVGAQGLDVRGWELVSKSEKPENIRLEYEFLKGLRDMETMLQRIHPSGSFVCKTSLVGLFAPEWEDRCLPQLTGMALSQNVECTMTETDKVGLSGRVRMTNGKGDGSFTVHWKRAVSSSLIFESGITVSPESLILSTKFAKTIFSRSAIIVQPSVAYFPLVTAFSPGCAFTFVRRLSPLWQGSIALSLGAQHSLTTSLVHMEMNQPKYLFNVVVSPTNSHVRAVYTKRYVEHDSFYETSFAFGFFGIMPAINFERRLSRYSRIGCSISLSLPNCLLNAKFKLKTGSSVYEHHLMLCDNEEDFVRATVFGTLLPFAAFHLAKALFRRTYERIMSLFDDCSEERQVDNIKREEASNIINLMRPTADRIAREEEAKEGLVIVEAKYGQMIGHGRSAQAYPLLGDRVIDVTVPLQAMVNDSQLRIYSAKSQLPGFYDPCPMEAKALKVVYRYRGHVHSVSVPDEMALHIPLTAHRLSIH